MLSDRLTCVVDTNVIVDYPAIIPGMSEGQPDEPTIDLSNAHIVIPSAVVRELSSFKKENSERGKTARMVLKYIREVAEGEISSLEHIYSLSAVHMPNSNQLMSILPVHKDFKNCLPYSPSDEDMDGQIILTALAAKMILGGYRADGTADPKSVMSLPCDDNVILLTNDNGLAIRARERGIVTSRYGYKYPAPYTGRRDLVVSKDLFTYFYSEKEVDREIWEDEMPLEQPLVANEFIAMRLENPNDYPLEFLTSGNPYFRHIGRYDAKQDKIVGLKYVSQAPFQVLNDGQAMYAEALLDPDFSAVICTGPAGSGKTYLSTAYGISACQEMKYMGVAVVPCADYGTLGALPGGLNEKMILDVGPIRNAIRNYILSNNPHIKRELEKARRRGLLMSLDEYIDGKPERSLNDIVNEYVNIVYQLFRNIPVEKARGLDFSHEFVLYDEFQDQSPSQADMLIKRIGKGGKLVIMGDIKQIHAPYLDENNNGITYASRELYNSPMVARVSLLEEDVERHDLVKMIAERQARRNRGV
ncbi:PhoH family protein [Candidatus Saccharibacteria bacterium]|nr:PhoH family protein [Candidatus Saccharibacteria bacterium]